MTEQFAEVWLQYSKTSASVLLRTDHSFQREQQRQPHSPTSATEVQHPLDQCKRPHIWQFKHLSQPQTRICINPGTFVMGTMTFRKGGRLSGHASSANALSCCISAEPENGREMHQPVAGNLYCSFSALTYLQTRASE